MVSALDMFLDSVNAECNSKRGREEILKALGSLQDLFEDWQDNDLWMETFPTEQGEGLVVEDLDVHGGRVDWLRRLANRCVGLKSQLQLVWAGYGDI